MKVTINYGEIKQGDNIYKAGDEMEIQDSKLSRLGDQVSQVGRVQTPAPVITPEPVVIPEPVKEESETIPENVEPETESGKGKGKNK